MAKEKKEAKKKATTTVTVVCPSCSKKLEVSAYRKRTNEKIKAEYAMWGEVVADDQGTFEGMEGEPTGEVKEE